MELSNTERIVKTGTFLYDGLPLCRVRIVQTDFKPGSGDHEDSEEWREDQTGIFFRIDYRPPRSDHFAAAGGYCASLEEAMDAVAMSVQGVAWDARIYRPTRRWRQSAWAVAVL
jgi:hypothetical protein